MIDPAADYAAWQVKVAGKNVSEVSLLATDYLNHFNEVVMMIGMIPDMPEMLDDVRAWQPKSYADHFRDSGFAAKDVAIEAYAHSPAQFRAPFDLTIERLNTEVAENVETLTRLVAAGDAAELRATAEESSRQLQSLIELASSIISGNAMNQAEIDRMLRKG